MYDLPESSAAREQTVPPRTPFTEISRTKSALICSERVLSFENFSVNQLQRVVLQ
jgi:hypothetical protein